jgi:hypothetical protein
VIRVPGTASWTLASWQRSSSTLHSRRVRFALGRTVRVYSVGRRCDTGATEGTSYAGSRVGAVRGVRHPVRRLPEIG